MPAQQKPRHPLGKPAPAPQDDNFLDLVQAHERTWGTENYPGKPSLADLLNAPVVMVWGAVNPQEARLMMTIHQTLDELNKYATRVLLQTRLELPNRRLVAVYVRQKKAHIRGVSVELGGVELP